jgi:probable HAF family extracellular repeat protein
MTRPSVTWTLAALVIALPAAVPAAPPQYLITPITPPAGNGIGAQAINNRGQVVGTLSNLDPEPSPRAFLYTPGVGSQFLPLLPGFERSTAGDINDAGDIVGFAEHQEPFEPPVGGFRLTDHGFLYRNGSVTDLAAPGDTRHKAWGVSNNGYIVGTNQNAAYRRQGDTVSDLGQYNGLFTDVRSVNDAGDVVGYAPFTGGSHALLYHNGAYTDLGTLGGVWANPRRINNSGQVVGESTNAAGVYHAFVYADGVMRDILGETTGGQAMGINDLGQIVGLMDTGGAYGHGFLYDNGTVTDLNSLVQLEQGWTVTGANDINDVGQILAVIQDGQGVFRDVVLTPVPEPASAAALCLAGAALLLRRRR